jgi:hypothetical protein
MDLFEMGDRIMRIGCDLEEQLSREERQMVREAMLLMGRSGWLAWKQRNHQRILKLGSSNPLATYRWLHQQSDRPLLVRAAYEHYFCAGNLLCHLAELSAATTPLASAAIVHRALRESEKDLGPWVDNEDLDPTRHPKFDRDA